MVDNQDAIITYIRAQLVARGWSTINEEFIEDPIEPENNCRLELIHDDGRRHGWGMFSRLCCWTEAFEVITGQPWINAVFDDLAEQ